MDSLGHSSFPPTALGRQDDEEVTPGTVLWWVGHYTRSLRVIMEVLARETASVWTSFSYHSIEQESATF
ncbi:hypothetical protein TNCV_411931 [Trichonephila clavipes]|nr:hypothetical protein TNCV_411931 [Trichonephila clavipes]